MSRYAFPAAPSAVADAPKAAVLLFSASEALTASAAFEAFASAAFDGARS